MTIQIRHVKHTRNQDFNRSLAQRMDPDSRCDVASSLSELFVGVRATAEHLGFEDAGENVFVRRCPTGLTHRMTIPIDVPSVCPEYFCTINLMVGPTLGNDSVGAAPRICVNIGSVMGEGSWHWFPIPMGAGLDDLLLQLSSCIHEYAVPWFDCFQSINDLRSVSRHGKAVVRRSLNLADLVAH